MAADDNWKELPEEQAWRECEAMLRRLLSSYLGGTAREHDAGEDGIAKAGMIFVAHHRAGYLLPFAYYVRVARNEAASAMRRRRWEEPVDFDEPSSRRHLRHRLEAHDVSADAELSPTARLLLGRLGFGPEVIGDFDPVRERLLHLAADACEPCGQGRLLDVPTAHITAVFSREQAGRTLLEGVSRLVERPSVSTPHVVLAVAAALTNRRLDVVMLERHLALVAGGATKTGAHAKRVERIIDDLLFREPGVSEKVEEA